jgi:hypothetical protein
MVHGVDMGVSPYRLTPHTPTHYGITQRPPIWNDQVSDSSEWVNSTFEGSYSTESTGRYQLAMMPVLRVAVVSANDTERYRCAAHGA